MNLLFLVPHPLPLPFDFGIKLLSTNSIDEPCSQNAHAYTHAKKILKHFWFIRWHLCVDIKMRRNWLKPQRCIVHLLFSLKHKAFTKSPITSKLNQIGYKSQLNDTYPNVFFHTKKNFYSIEHWIIIVFTIQTLTKMLFTSLIEWKKMYSFILYFLRPFRTV